MQDHKKEKAWKKFLSFKEAREKARAFGFESVKDYRARYKNIPGLRSNPDTVYRNKGWNGWCDFLGTNFLFFEDAQKKAQAFGFKNRRDYQARCKNIPGLPSNPDINYKDKGWKGWGDFLGTGRSPQVSEEILPFEEAREKAQEFGFKDRYHYFAMYESIPELPRYPEIVYRNKGWTNWKDFLGK